MNPKNALSFVPSLVTDRVRTWSIESQQGARRNAMIASTALAARRAERQDVDEFFESMPPAAPAPQLPVVAHR